MVYSDCGNSQRAPVEEPEDADGRHRDSGDDASRAQRERNTAVHHRGQHRRRRRTAHEVPLSRPAPCVCAEKYGVAPQNDDSDAQLPRLARFHRGGNADSDWFNARRRTRFRRSEPNESRSVLCAAAVAPNAEAVADGVGFRPLFPDCKMLPRRGPSRRPSARIHANRLRNVVCRPRRRARDFRGFGSLYFQGDSRRGTACKVAADDVARGDASLR